VGVSILLRDLKPKDEKKLYFVNVGDLLFSCRDDFADACGENERITEGRSARSTRMPRTHDREKIPVMKGNCRNAGCEETVVKQNKNRKLVRIVKTGL
jgi:hypothetical protein